jgi:transposase-like protein
VEVDETYLGGPEKDVHGRQTESKTILAVAAEIRGKAIGRIRVRQVPDASGESLVPFVCDVVAPGSLVRTDGWAGYADLAGKGYRHRVKNISHTNKAAHELLPSTHRVASLLKRWLLGTHQGAVSHEHVDYYLDEFTFRFNRRTSKARGLLFYRLAQQAVATRPAPYHALVGGRQQIIPQDVGVT